MNTHADPATDGDENFILEIRIREQLCQNRKMALKRD